MSNVFHEVTRVGPSFVGGRGLRIFHDGSDGGAKAATANRVEAPRAPTTNALREIAEVFAIAGFADCAGEAGAFTESEGVTLG